MVEGETAQAEAHCCEQMRDRLADGETAIWYLPKYRQYGIPVLDGGSSMIVIRFCPWCGVRFPGSLRTAWFNSLDRLGLELGDPAIPAAMQTDEWWKLGVVGMKPFKPFINVVKPAKPGVLHTCPCCRARTLNERGGFEVCPVCFWEDDGQDDHDADEVRGGPNGTLSLSEARENYARCGACEERAVPDVRPARPEER